jgi:cell shape-determining protein MreC
MLSYSFSLKWQSRSRLTMIVAFLLLRLMSLSLVSHFIAILNVVVLSVVSLSVTAPLSRSYEVFPSRAALKNLEHKNLNLLLDLTKQKSLKQEREIERGAGKQTGRQTDRQKTACGEEKQREQRQTDR